MRLKCDVHPWMFAYVNIVDHPFHAVTDTNGLFRLPPALPPGKYVVTAVHLKAGNLVQEVSVGAGERRQMDFYFTVPSGVTPQVQASIQP